MLRHNMSLLKMDEELLLFYERKCKIIQRFIPDQTLSMDHCFVNITLIKHSDTNHSERGNDIQNFLNAEQEEYAKLRNTFNRPRSSEEIFKAGDSQRILQIHQLFDKNEPSQFAKRIFMLGRAGVGKTTLCRKIINEYYFQNLWNDKFERIIWIPLRVLKQTIPTTNSNSQIESNNVTDVKIGVAEIYALWFFASFGQNSQNLELANALEVKNLEDETKVLYLLDGWDEIQDVLHIPHIKQILDVLCKKPFVIVTSRPYTFHENYNHFDFIMETVGFSEENIIEYIRVVNEDNFEEQKEILQFIHSSAGNIAGMASIPILLDIICSTWKTIKKTIAESQETQLTMTKLYETLETFLWCQNIQKSDGEFQIHNAETVKKSEIYNHLQDSLKIDPFALPKVAYECLSKNKIEFTAKEAMKSPDHDASVRISLKKTNFLHCVNPTEDKIDEMDKSYVFIHLTLQEYLAAVYIVKLIREHDPEVDVVICHKYNPRYSIVWSFVAGLLAEIQRIQPEDTYLELFWNYLERDPIDELGFAHQYLMLNCLNECSHSLNDERGERLINELFSFIWTQYIGGGNSLFAGVQLPKKLLEKLILQKPEEWWEADSEKFQLKVLKEQHNLPDEFVKHFIDQIDSLKITQKSKYFQFIIKVLQYQHHFGTDLFNSVINKIDRLIPLPNSAEKNNRLLKLLAVLNTKKLLMVNEQILETLKNLLDIKVEKSAAVCDSIVNICLKLREIPAEIIEKIFMMQKYKTMQSEKSKNRKNREKIKKVVPPSEKEILIDIIKNEKFYTANTMEIIFKQKYFDSLREDFFQNFISDTNLTNNSVFLCRLLFLVCRDKLDDHIIQKLFSFVEAEKSSATVRRMALYAIGNMKTLPGDVAIKLLNALKYDTHANEINGDSDFTCKKLICTDDGRKRTQTVDISYMIRLIPLMKLEFYETHRTNRCRESYRKHIYMSDRDYDVIIHKFLTSSNDDLGNYIHTRIFKRYRKYDLCMELATHWTKFWTNHSEWNKELQIDGPRFLRRYAADFKNFRGIFDAQHRDLKNEIKHYKNAFKILLKEERELDTQIFWDVVLKYLPLVAFAHHAYNKPYSVSKLVRDTEGDNELEAGLTTLYHHFGDTFGGKPPLPPVKPMSAVTNQSGNSEGVFKNDVIENVVIEGRNQTHASRIEYQEVQLEISEDLMREYRKTFLAETEKMLLDILIVRALRDCEIPKVILSQMENIFDPAPNQQVLNKATKENVLQVLEYKPISQKTIGDLIYLLEESGDEEEAKFCAFALTRQNIENEDHINTLLEMLHSNKSIHVATIFEFNSTLMNGSRKKLLWLLESNDLLIRVRAVLSLRSSQIEDVDTIKKILNTLKMCDGDKVNIGTTCLQLLLRQKRLPDSIIEMLVDDFDTDEMNVRLVYLWFLESLNGPISFKNITHLFRLLDIKYVEDVREGGHDNTTTERTIKSILKNQPLWNIIRADYNQPARKNAMGVFTTKEKMIVEKIIQDPVPMAILKRNGKLCVFSPDPTGDNTWAELNSPSIDLILESLYEKRDSCCLNLPRLLDPLSRYLQFHSPQENLQQILNLHLNLERISEDELNFQIFADRDIRYIQVKKRKTECISHKIFIENIIVALNHEFEKFQYSHLDLSENELTTEDLYDIKETLQKKQHGFNTLILSNNKITIEGIECLMNGISIKKLYLDRNFIFLTDGGQVRNYFDETFVNGVKKTISYSSEIKRGSKVGFIDLSMNYMPHNIGEIKEGDERNDLKNCILKNANFIHSQNLDEWEKFEGCKNLENVLCLCDIFTVHDVPGKISKKEGCVIVAEEVPMGFIAKHIFKRGYAFIAIEWIPDSNYGQRQIILVDLNKNAMDGNRLEIRIKQTDPSTLIEKLQEKNCADFRRFFAENEKIKELLNCIYKSQKKCDVSDYFAFSSVKGREMQGRYNCMTWADEMLKVLDIKRNAVGKSWFRLHI